MSQHSPILHFGLEKPLKSTTYSSGWPDGRITDEENLPVRRMIHIHLIWWNSTCEE